MGLVEGLMSKLTIPYEDEEEEDKVNRKSKRKGDFRDQVARGVEAMGVKHNSFPETFSTFTFPGQPEVRPRA